MTVHNKNFSLDIHTVRERYYTYETMTDFTFVCRSLSLWYQRDYLYSCYYRSLNRMDRVDWFWKVKKDLRKKIKAWN